MKRIAIIGFGIIFSFNTLARPLLDSEKEAVENIIKEEMKDPESARFYHADFPYPDKTNTYCGYVNAKNSYGGYAGKQLFATFVAINNKNKVIALSYDFNPASGEPLSQEVLASLCAEGGYDIPVNKFLFKKVNIERKKHQIPPLSDVYRSK